MILLVKLRSEKALACTESWKIDNACPIGLPSVLHGLISFFLKGYRVISVDIPRAWNNHEWIQAFEKFLDAIDVHHIHLYGTALGGFLAQLFAQHRPRRVRSLVLSNTFVETTSFSASMPWARIVGWAPAFILKRHVLSGIRDSPQEPFIADSVDFVVSQVETLEREDLASRLTLTADAASVGPLLLPDSSITLMDTNDYCATPLSLKDQVCERYPGARRAYLKSGGDFPFLSRPDEVNLHLQLHLRRVGVEARPDLIPGVPKDDSGGSSKEPNNGRKDADDSSENDKRDSETPPTESAEPPLAPEATGSHDLDNQLLKMAKLSNDTGESVTPPSENSFFRDKQNLLVSRAILNITCEIFILNMLSLYLGNCTLTENVAAM